MTTDELTVETERIIVNRGGLNASLIRDSLAWMNERLPVESIDRETFISRLVYRPMVLSRGDS